MAKAKYKKGKKIESVADFEKSTCTYFKVHDRTIHRAWIESWQYRTLKNFIMNSYLYETEMIEK